MRKFLWIVAGLLLALAAVAAGVFFFTPAGAFAVNAPAVGAGYAAELMCGGVFVMGREPGPVLADDILPVNPLLKYASVEVDRAGGTVAASLFHLASRTALYRPGLGCTLVGKDGVAALKAQAEGLTPMEMRDRPAPWPAGDQVQTRESPALAKALDAAFADGTGSRALLVVQDGRLVAERYAPGFSKDTRFLGWSMAKSVTSALVGTMAAQGKADLDAPAPVPEWKDATDGRQAITLRQLLTMTSGLHFTETYLPGDDATTMFYRRDDMAAYAATRSLDHRPGVDWNYSSGSSDIVSRLVFTAAGGSAAGAYNYLRTRLFEPAGMTSAIFEPDATGSPVGSSYLYMTARDWARFGQLYIGDGQVGWQRLFGKDWVAQSHRPTQLADGRPVAYGLQFWLNSDGTDGAKLRLPDCPADLYMAEGHNGQVVAIIPSERAVLVRLGWTTGEARFDTNRHFVAILDALRSGSAPP
ncbi:MAG TPA: serine hydrolase [Magnetospirillaceae bacterium]|nr:serine hydrolase [Magnetospirillaceae bacterium]